MIVHGQDRKGLQLELNRANFLKSNSYVIEKWPKIDHECFVFFFVRVIWDLSFTEIQVREKMTENI